MPAKVGYLVIDAKLGKNRVHLESFRWRCMADPEGNEFDIDVLPAS